MWRSLHIVYSQILYQFLTFTQNLKRSPFIPFGFLLPIAYPRIKAFFKVFLVGMFAVLFIKIFQYMTRLGSFDIDDIILNMVGVLSGYGTFGLVNHVLLKER